MEPVHYCHNPYHYQRRLSREVKVGPVGIGGANPIRVQSMLTCDTMDTRECVKQTLDLVKVGCEIVRITAPTVKDAANLKNIKAELTAAGCQVPIVADIHFKPDAAMEAAQWIDKVRVNPGNFADKKKFAIREYTDEQYNEELERIDETFKPLVDLCRQRGIAMRIGTNHGSLSDRIMNRFGDTPAGMVESAVEFARIARKYGYHDFVFSMKSSNPKVMINAYRLLAARLLELGPDWNYPLHLGVTEAGDGEDGRIKSAIGIGALLADGLGDTIRVSLTEDSVHEIPVARALVSLAGQHVKDELPPQQPPLSFDPFIGRRRRDRSGGRAGQRRRRDRAGRVSPGRGRRLVYVGAGTSGRLGVLDASECPPTFRTDPEQVQAIIAGGPGAVFRAVEGAEDDAVAGGASIDERSVGPADVVVGIAASGTTPFVWGALRQAIDRGARTVLLACVPPVGGEPPVDVQVRPITGPEVLTGSTRLKAGTATKLVLNQITTLAMVRLGKTYGNRMVDVRASNAKLRGRAVRMVTELTDLDAAAATAALDAAGGHVKVAVVMVLRSVSADEARRLLDAVGGRLRAVLFPRV